MGNATAARKIATAAAYGGGGLSLLGGAAYGVLTLEAKVARHLIGVNEDPVPDATGWYGRKRSAPAFRIALLGDSSAAGYGVSRVEDTPGAVLAASVSEQSDRRVYIREYCRVGAQSADLAGQVDLAASLRPHVAVLLIGANDVTHSVLPATSVRHLGDAVRRLRALGAEVVVGTCPDLGTIRPIPQPLRQIAQIWSRRLAAAQTIATVEAGGRSVALASLLGPEFHASPALFFGPDRFHPSEAGYAALAGALVPSVLAALGEGPEDETAPQAARGESVLPLAQAAAAAVATPGAELDAGTAEEARRGLATLMRRRRHPQAPAEKPALDAPADEGSLPTQ